MAELTVNEQNPLSEEILSLVLLSSRDIYTCSCSVYTPKGQNLKLTIVGLAEFEDHLVWPWLHIQRIATPRFCVSKYCINSSGVVYEVSHLNASHENEKNPS